MSPSSTRLPQSLLPTLAGVCAFLVMGCAKTGEPGKFDDFLSTASTAGITTPAVCQESNDGKVYWLEGFLHLGSGMSLQDGKTTLAFYRDNDQQGDGKGNYVSVKVRLEGWLRKGDVDDLWKSAKKIRSGGFRTRQGEVDEADLRIHLADGSVAGAQDKIRLSLAVAPVPNIHQNMPLVCEYEFVSASKI